MLDFCPVCKSLLLLKKEGDKTIGYCTCGFKRAGGVEISSCETNKSSLDSAGVFNKNINEGFFHKCSKCGWEYCDVNDLGEILNSEASVCLFNCRKCGHVDREIGKA